MAKAVRRTDPNARLTPAPQPVEVAGGLFQFVQNPLAAAEQDFPFRSHPNPLSRTIQEPASELIFERPHGMTDRRLGDE